MKMEETVCSKTSVYKIQTPGNYPKERIQQLSVESPVLIHIHILVLASIDQGLASPTLFVVACVVLFLPAKIFILSEVMETVSFQTYFVVTFIFIYSMYMSYNLISSCNLYHTTDI
jgi:hypothetical protein